MELCGCLLWFCSKIVISVSQLTQGQVLSVGSEQFSLGKEQNSHRIHLKSHRKHLQKPIYHFFLYNLLINYCLIYGFICFK